MLATSVNDLKRCLEAINVLMQPFVCVSFLPQTPAQAAAELAAARAVQGDAASAAAGSGGNAAPGASGSSVGEGGAEDTTLPPPPPPASAPGAPTSNTSSSNSIAHDVPPKATHHGVHVRLTANARFVGIWPLPESYHPATTDALLPRDAHPRIVLGLRPTEPIVVEGLPFDKYELEGSPLTAWILAKKKTNLCWPCYMPKRCVCVCICVLCLREKERDWARGMRYK